jgi:hypothetical protein
VFGISRLVSAKQKSSISSSLAWVLIASGVVALPFTVKATSPAELVGNVSSVCAATGTSTTLAAWGNSGITAAEPDTGFLTKWGTASNRVAVGMTATKSGTSVNLADVPNTKDTSRYLSYPFTTDVSTRIVLDEIFYGDMITTAVNMQAELFSVSDSVATRVTGAETAEVVSDSSTTDYTVDTFDFPDTLLASSQAYEMRLYVWYEASTINGFDDFGIAFKPCLAGAPTLGEITRTATTASVSFTPPTITGGSAITNYEYSLDAGSTWTTRSPVATTSPLSITGLVNGVSPDIQLRAVTTAGSGVASSSKSPAPQVQVSVFNQPGLNGGPGCDGENDNLIAIVNNVSGYAVDGSITDFVDRAGEPTLASQLASSEFFFMTDMENADPANASFLPDSAKTAINSWTSNGGVMVMTGTSGAKDVLFLNSIYGWNLQNAAGGTATELTANTAGTPFSNATNGVSLSPHSATDSIGGGTVPNFTPMWVTAAGNAAVAVIKFGSGYVIYMGWDFFNSGPSCPEGASPWVTGIVPAALAYATELSQSGLENPTTTGGDLKYSFSQTGTTYYVVVPAGSAVPTNAEIKALGNYGAVSVITSGQGAVTANVERIFGLSGLSQASDYTAYLVTEYMDEGVATFSTQQVVNFSTRPGTPTLVSAEPDTDGNIDVTLTPSGGETNFEYSVDGGVNWISRNPASTSGVWRISGLTVGTEASIQFRSFYNRLGSSTTTAVNVTPVLAPGQLTNLVPSVGTLTPSFSGTTFSYQLSVPSSTLEITLTPTSASNSITVASRAVVSGQASQTIDVLRDGATVVTVGVTRLIAGAVTTVYTVEVVRQAASSQGSFLPAPTPTASPSPRPAPTRPPALVPAPIAPSVLPSPRPTQTTPAPTPNASPVPVVMPRLDPTPGVVFGSVNPIPQQVVDVLAAPLAYVLSALDDSPQLPALAPAESLAYENGSPVEIQLVRTDEDNGYVLRGDGWEVALEATDSSGAPLALDGSGNIVLNTDRFVQFSGTGFAPGSIIKVWLFSDPAEIAEVLADASGNFVGQAQLPEGIPTGEHTVQLNGLTKDGQLRSVSLGVVVQPDLVVAPAPLDLTGLMNGLLILAAGVLLVFFILWRRRKKKEEEGAIPSSSGIEGVPILASEGFQSSQSFPDDSRKKIGPGAPPNRKRNFKPKGA